MPIIQGFQARHNIEGLVVVADADMLSAANLTALDGAGFRFIVGTRQTKAPHDLESHFYWHGDDLQEGQVIDTVTPRHVNSKVNSKRLKAESVWDEAMESSWRAVWAYSAKRAHWDERTLEAQRRRALAAIEGTKPTRKPRFVKQGKTGACFDQAAFDRTLPAAGLKGYVTNIPATLMPLNEVISLYHDLWHVEQSFRMSKTDLRTRPIFRHQRDATQAHLTIVTTALAISRCLYQKTGIKTKKLVQSLRPFQEQTIQYLGFEIQSSAPITPKAQKSSTHWGTKIVQLGCKIFPWIR
ncbi:IS1634 family transposase [Arcanobacterium hippocoleae]